MTKLAKRKATHFIVVHCAFTRRTQNVSVADIRAWHTQPRPRGRGWAEIGYHDYIKFDGTHFGGRPEGTVGAGVKGWNASAIHICLEGGMGEDGKPANNFTPEQMERLRALLTIYREWHPEARIRGHRDFPNVAKDCPCFDVREWCRVVGIDPK